VQYRIKQLVGYTRKRHNIRSNKHATEDSHLALFTVHLVASPPATTATAPGSTPSSTTAASTASPLLMDILHILDRFPLRFAHALHIHHRLVLVDDLLRDLHTQRILDPQPNFKIILGNEANGLTTLSCSCCATDAVDVGLRVAGEVEVDDEIDSRDVETASCYVGGYEDVSAAAAELVEGSQTSGLGELAVQWDGTEAEGAEENGTALDFVHCSGEDDSRVADVIVEEMDQIQVLVLMRHCAMRRWCIRAYLKSISHTYTYRRYTVVARLTRPDGCCLRWKHALGSEALRAEVIQPCCS
jgi:hypothetical protein